ncbi:MAG TPA: PVC-type heme-binding CxxCH protein [Candidatus Limnocylindria bacterium]|nr:PVC-type heme-binding CxxCH protein [Candidatus Limnocylindria bacterium]
MHRLLRALLGLSIPAAALAAELPPVPTHPTRSLFDGRTLANWEGDPKLWRVENGLIVGGSLKETVTHNDFLASNDHFTNFVIRLKFKLTGTGFVNSGVQIRSEREPNSPEMAGYQCDIGDPNWWGSLYDESRRNKVLAWSDMAALEPMLHRDDWNDYVIRADGTRITTWINGVLGMDYFEVDPSIIGSGRIGFQIHGGGAAEAYFKDITIEELPVRPKAVGAAQPPPLPHPSPLTPEEEQASFSVPPGFKVELVAAEPEGGKFVAVSFDHAGRMWTMTALEYPLDANETPAEAKALFGRGGKDRALVFDTPTRLGRQKARTFAEGLAIPLGLLPYKDGAYVQYGPEIRFYQDKDGDGKADGFTPALTGFGYEDSHLFPHQFTRAPGGWLWMAQGAFNYSKVKTTGTPGSVTEFNRTKLARFHPDGSQFEIIGWGPCNIWGLVMDRFGETFIQEANDQGWPMMPFLESGSYPLCGEDVPRPYAPPFPKTGEREMGGTGLSGLALSEGADSFPGVWHDVFFLANPITERIQAIRLHRGSAGDTQGDFGNGWRLEHLPDFVTTSDSWFRPVAMTFGPDGCLYIVDWYNKIISHNEVPRNHPERDKTRGRVWRVRHESQPERPNLPDLYKASEAELLTHLNAADTWEANAAWQEISDRQAVGLAPQLASLVTDEQGAPDLRIRALWCLENLSKATVPQLQQLAKSKHRSIRKEALRVMGNNTFPANEVFALANEHLTDPDRLVRQEAMRALARLVERIETSLDRTPASGVIADQAALNLLQAAAAAPDGDWAKAPRYFRDFERYIIRRVLEKYPQRLIGALGSNGPKVSAEAKAFAAITVGGTDGAKLLAGTLGSLPRGLTTDELVLLASVPNDPTAHATLEKALGDAGTLRLLYDNRTRIPDHAALAPLLTSAAKQLLAKDGSDANQDLMVRLATGFHLTGLESELITAATKPNIKPEGALAAIRALRESGSTRVDVLRQLAFNGNDAVRREAVLALAASKSDAAVPALLDAWPNLTPALRKVAVDRLASSAGSARGLLDAVKKGAIATDELDGYSLEKLATVLPGDAQVKQLQIEIGNTLRPVLHLDGGDDDYIDTDLTLDGPFTVETWVKLDPGIANTDSLIGSPTGLDANFFDSRFRVYVGGSIHDAVVAKKPMTAEVWTHIAFTRDAEGRFRIYLNGELDNTSEQKDPTKYEHEAVGRSNPSGGTGGEFAEYRVWKVCRTADEIRASANLILDAQAAGSDLVYLGTGENWGKLHGKARLNRTSDLPSVITAAEAKVLEAKFAQIRALANQPGDLARGRVVFTGTCGVCHTIKGEGGKIGPVLDGAGANGVEALLRNILTPNAAMEAGYRRFRVETADGDVVEGLLAGQDADSVTLRQPNTEDQKFLRTKLKRAGFQKTSIMPEGLMDGLQPGQISDLFAYLKTLR